MRRQNFSNIGQETREINCPSQDSDIFLLGSQPPCFPEVCWTKPFWLCGFLLRFLLMLKVTVPTLSQNLWSSMACACKSC